MAASDGHAFDAEALLFNPRVVSDSQSEIYPRGRRHDVKQLHSPAFMRPTQPAISDIQIGMIMIRLQMAQDPCQGLA